MCIRDSGFPVGGKVLLAAADNPIRPYHYAAALGGDFTSNITGLNFSVDGNQLTITSSQAIKGSCLLYTSRCV